MSKKTKIWLWFALILSTGTTIMNAFFGRRLSVLIAVTAIAGLCVLLFTGKRWGFFLMCICYTLSFAVGVWGGIKGEAGILPAIVMSFIGSALIPSITYLFLRGENHKEMRQGS